MLKLPKGRCRRRRATSDARHLARVLYWREGVEESLGRPRATVTLRTFLQLALFLQQDKHPLVLTSAHPRNTHSQGCNSITFVALHYTLSRASAP